MKGARDHRIAEAVATEERVGNTGTGKESVTETRRDTVLQAPDMSVETESAVREATATGTAVSVREASVENAAGRIVIALIGINAVNGTGATVIVSATAAKGIVGIVIMIAMREIVEAAIVAMRGARFQDAMIDTAIADMAEDLAGAGARLATCRPCLMSTTSCPSIRECVNSRTGMSPHQDMKTRRCRKLRHWVSNDSIFTELIWKRYGYISLILTWLLFISTACKHKAFSHLPDNLLFSDQKFCKEWTQSVRLSWFTSCRLALLE